MEIILWLWSSGLLTLDSEFLSTVSVCMPYTVLPALSLAKGQQGSYHRAQGHMLCMCRPVRILQATLSIAPNIARPKQHDFMGPRHWTTQFPEHCQKWPLGHSEHYFWEGQKMI